MKNKKFKTLLAAAVIPMVQTMILARASADAVCFVLSEYNGHVALLEDGCDEPLAVYNTEISSLYPADAEMLRQGIRLQNRAELSRLIEDLELE